jgi:hypothetical protein
VKRSLAAANAIATGNIMRETNARAIIASQPQ